VEESRAGTTQLTGDRWGFVPIYGDQSVNCVSDLR
jgi:hypothetical protein